MVDLARNKTMSLRASERARWSLGLRRTATALVAPGLLMLVRPEDWLPAATLSLLALGITILTWRGRSLGRGAVEGAIVATTVVVAGAMTDACAPGASPLLCGVPCLAVGFVAAVMVEVAAPSGPHDIERRAAALAVAAVGSIAGCAHLGIGIALAAGLITTAGALGTVVLRPALRGLG